MAKQRRSKFAHASLLLQLKQPLPSLLFDGCMAGLRRKSKLAQRVADLACHDDRAVNLVSDDAFTDFMCARWCHGDAS